MRRAAGRRRHRRFARGTLTIFYRTGKARGLCAKHASLQLSLVADSKNRQRGDQGGRQGAPGDAWHVEGYAGGCSPVLARLRGAVGGRSYPASARPALRGSGGRGSGANPTDPSSRRFPSGHPAWVTRCTASYWKQAGRHCALQWAVYRDYKMEPGDNTVGSPGAVFRMGAGITALLERKGEVPITFKDGMADSADARRRYPAQSAQ